MLTELDAQVGRLLDHLEKSGELANTVFIYTSDHGEMLGEHGLWTKNQHLEYSARVPILIAGPGLPKGKTVETPVSHVDLIATLLDLTGTPPKTRLRGHSLVPIANGSAGSHPGFAYSETHSDGNYTGGFMIRKGDWKYIYFSGDRPLLFNLKQDPGEFDDVSGKPENAAVIKELHGLLTGLVDPDAVTRQAFEAQARRLDELVRSKTKQEFYRYVLERLGPGQSWALTERLYAKSARPSTGTAG
jgi:choline-sulfatase